MDQFAPALQPFVRSLCSTQAFASFVLERCEPAPDAARAAQLFFFDWCCAAQSAAERGTGGAYLESMSALLSGRALPPVAVKLLEPRSSASLLDAEAAAPRRVFAPFEAARFEVDRRAALRRCAPFGTSDEPELTQQIESLLSAITDLILDRKQRRVRARGGGSSEDVARGSAAAASVIAVLAGPERARPGGAGAGVGIGGIIGVGGHVGLAGGAAASDPLRATVVVNGARWPAGHAQAVFELWLSLALDPDLDCRLHARADAAQRRQRRRDLLDALVQVRAMVSLGLDLSSEMLSALLSFAVAFELWDEFQFIFRALSAFVPRFAERAECYLGVVEAALAANSYPPARRDLTVFKQRPTAETLTVDARCPKCAAALPCEAVFASFELHAPESAAGSRVGGARVCACVRVCVWACLFGACVLRACVSVCLRAHRATCRWRRRATASLRPLPLPRCRRAPRRSASSSRCRRPSKPLSITSTAAARARPRWRPSPRAPLRPLLRPKLAICRRCCRCCCRRKTRRRRATQGRLPPRRPQPRVRPEMGLPRRCVRAATARGSRHSSTCSCGPSRPSSRRSRRR